jgi:hypothetical protein
MTSQILMVALAITWTICLTAVWCTHLWTSRRQVPRCQLTYEAEGMKVKLGAHTVEEVEALDRLSRKAVPEIGARWRGSVSP